MTPDDLTRTNPPADPTRTHNPSEAALDAGLAAASGGETSHDSPPSADPEAGTVIAGRYKLLQQIGEGGMGEVWMAEQTEPVKRKVAVKLIRADRGGPTILARFEAERQAIALMDHPHISKLLDAGTTADDRPFFVMELVKGVPLTEYCDSHKLTIPARLALFQQICSAVQHAHQKGVIHRDLKPGNILVESHDGKPVPKVIDFGLAKAATGLRLTENTLFTGYGTVMGTPLYMAPEQASFNAVDVDTRADVYALGVILYELLTGTTPITRETIKKAQLDEMMRLIREQDAPTPSSRLSSSDSTPSVAANRQTEPAKLGRFVKGELDWIVLKALSKDRDRRYESATTFAADVGRFLNHEAVTAHPPSVGYRVRTFVRRNKGPVLAGALVFVALAVGMIGTMFGLLRAEQKREEADQARQRESERAEGERQAKEREAEQRGIAEESRRKAVVAADDERKAKEDQIRLRGIANAETNRAIAFRESALGALRAATSEDVEKLIGGKAKLGANEIAYLEAIAGRWQALARTDGTSEEARAIRGEGHSQVAFLWHLLGRRDEARREYELAIANHKKLIAEFPLMGYRSNLARWHNQLGVLLDELGQRDAAVAEYREALAINHKLAKEFPDVHHHRAGLGGGHINLGGWFFDSGKWDDARREYEQAVPILKQLVTEFPHLPEYQNHLALGYQNLGALLARLGKRDDAKAKYDETLVIRKRLVVEHPSVPEYQQELASSHNSVGAFLDQAGEAGAAEAEFGKALAILDKLTTDYPAIPDYQIDLGECQFRLGGLIRDRGKPADSLSHFDKAVAALEPVFKAEPTGVRAKTVLADCHAGRAIAHGLLQDSDKAVADWDAAMGLGAKEKRPEYRLQRMMCWLNIGKVTDAVVEAEELRKLPGWNAGQSYDFVRAYTFASDKLPEKRGEYQDRAMELLRKAVKEGFSDTEYMKRDDAMNPLRKRDDFKKLLADLEAKFPPKKDALPPPRADK